MASVLGFAQCCCAQRSDGDELAINLSGWEPSSSVNFQTSATQGEDKRLQVPANFSIRSIDSGAAATSSGYVSLNQEQKAREMTKLQNMIRDFVMEFLQGVILDAVLEDGTLVPCRCVMDSKLEVLALQVHNMTRQIDLGSVQEICSGNELRDLRVTTPLDDLCVTLVMTDDQCVSFKFGNVQAREHFATCMKVLRLALD
jgi:hypothetical protein